MKNSRVVREIKENLKKGLLTKQEAKTLKGKALNGDEEGALKGMHKIGRRVKYAGR